MTISGTTTKGLVRSRGCRLPSTRSAIFTSPFNAASIDAATRSARRNSSSSRSKARGEEDRIERHPVGGGEDLGIDDIAPRRRTGTGDDGEQARMVRGDHRDLG